MVRFKSCSTSASSFYELLLWVGLYFCYFVVVVVVDNVLFLLLLYSFHSALCLLLWHSSAFSFFLAVFILCQLIRLRSTRLRSIRCKAFHLSLEIVLFCNISVHSLAHFVTHIWTICDSNEWVCSAHTNQTDPANTHIVSFWTVSQLFLLQKKTCCNLYGYAGQSHCLIHIGSMKLNLFHVAHQQDVTVKLAKSNAYFLHRKTPRKETKESFTLPIYRHNIIYISLDDWENELKMKCLHSVYLRVGGRRWWIQNMICIRKKNSIF